MALPTEKETNDSRVEHVTSGASVKSSENGVSKDGLADNLEARQAAAQWQDNTPEERRLTRKLDWRILPCTWVLYLLGYLDRSNIGFVKMMRSQCNIRLT
jgi:hypothetical protein